MKRIIVFLGLKIMEIGLILLIPFGVGKLFSIPKYLKYMEWTYTGFWATWFWGILNTMFIVAAIALICVLIAGIVCNWDKAGRMIGK